MVGYNPNQAVQLSHVEHSVAGAVSGAVSRGLCQPLDVLKIRFQLQIEPIRRLESSKYHGVLQAARKILREEGVSAFWKGHVPAQYLSIFYGLVQFSLFEISTKEMSRNLPELYSMRLRPLAHFVCGAFSSSAATILVHPLDVLRTRLVAQGEPKIYRSLWSAASRIRSEEGFFAFYRGLVPALATVTPQMGLQFGFYSFFMTTWNAVFGVVQSTPPGPIESLVCGSGSGVAAKLVIYPMDLTKKRLQVQGFEQARLAFGQVRQYTGTLDCLTKTFREEGIRGLYKGLAPSLLKAATIAGIHMSAYEQVCNILISRHQ